MKNDAEMMKLITDFAENDGRIRAAYMNGSRTNPNVEKDAYRDFDVVLSVSDTEPFISDKSWLNYFGEIAIMQEPDLNDCEDDLDKRSFSSYGYLVLYKDGNRIDFHVEALSNTAKSYGKDSLTLPLLDKDGILPQIAPPNESSYFILPPKKNKYRACCNEFWWCMNNVAKGIKRDQLSYAMWMYNSIEHEMLNRMLDWYAAMQHAEGITTGMKGKYYKKLLPSEMYTSLLKTYVDFEHLWDGVFEICKLFSQASRSVAEKYGFEYAESEETNTLVYLLSMRG